MSFWFLCTLVHDKLLHTHAVCGKLFEEISRFERIFNPLHVEIPFAHYVHFQGPVIENSAPEGLMCGNGEDLREDVRIFMFLQNTPFFNDFIRIDQNLIVLDVGDSDDHDQHGNNDAKRGERIQAVERNVGKNFFHKHMGKHGEKPCKQHRQEISETNDGPRTLFHDV